MIIFLSELQKTHLNLLHQHSVHVLVDFCKLAIDYLSNGNNASKHAVAADRLQISVQTVQDLVHAIVYLIVEGTKFKLSDSDFQTSLALAGLENEQQDVIVKLYQTKKKEITSVLHLLQQKDAVYQNLHWSFDVKLASRSCSQQMKPIVTLAFVLKTSKKFTTSNDVRENDAVKNTNILPALTVNTTIMEAKAANQCQNVIDHILLQCDLPNLLHLTNKLEQALKESKNQYVRKVQRALQ